MELIRICIPLCWIILTSVNGQSVRSANSIYSGCGTQKSCVGYPTDCIENRSCEYMVSFFGINDKVQFEVQSIKENNPAYVATGLSTNTNMGTDSIIECVYENGQINAYASWTTPRGDPRLNAIRDGVPQDTINLLETCHLNGMIYCRVERDAIHTVKEKEFNMLENKYHVMVATGTKVTETGITKHNIGKFVTESKYNMTDLDEKFSDDIYDGCDTKKNCFGLPTLCVQSKSCDFVASFLAIDGKMIFEMKSMPADKSDIPLYIATGLSNDNQMGEDSITECAYENGIVRSYGSWTTPRNPSGLNAIREGVPQNTLALIESSYRGNQLYCKVQRELTYVVNGHIFDVATRKYHFMIATGTTLRENGITKHDIGRGITAQALNITNIGDGPIVDGNDRAQLVKIHSSFMIFAWIGTGSVGMLVARYFKRTWTGQTINGKALWFSWHVMLMCSTWALHISAFIIIFVHVYGLSNTDTNPHAIIGIAATILLFFQPIMGLFRPNIDDPYRYLFNAGHALAGSAAHILAVIGMYFAVKLAGAMLPSTFYWVLSAYAITHFSTHIILSISGFIASRKNRSVVDKTIEDSHALFRKILLTVYVVVVFACTVTLIVLATT